MRRAFLLTIIAVLLVGVQLCCTRPTVKVQDLVFRDTIEQFSFRYPGNWRQVEPQSESTRVMLYADDGSQATCNVSVVPADRHSIRQYDEAYFREVIGPRLPDFELISVVQNNERVFVEFDFSLGLPGKTLPGKSLVMVTLHDGKRFMMICNMPRTAVSRVRPAFELMSGTFLISRRPGEYQIFRHEVEGFSFKYPGGWQIMSPQHPETKAALKKIGTENDWATCSVKVYFTTARSVSELNINSLSSLGSGMKDVSIQEVTRRDISGIDRVFVRCKWLAETSMQREKVSSVIMVIVKDHKQYMMVCHTAEETYNDFAPEFDLMMSTFSFDAKAP